VGLPRIYSQRLLSATGDAVVTRWTCPVGYRAVVKSIGAACGSAASQLYYAHINNVLFYMHSFPGANAGDNVNCAHVLYGGDVLGVTTVGLNCYVTVSGYVFEDPVGRPADALDLEVAPAPQPDELVVHSPG